MHTGAHMQHFDSENMAGRINYTVLEKQHIYELEEEKRDIIESKRNDAKNLMRKKSAGWI